jgi:tetratricopeptide (TPR) repeat protein
MVGAQPPEPGISYGLARLFCCVQNRISARLPSFRKPRLPAGMQGPGNRNDIISVYKRRWAADSLGLVVPEMSMFAGFGIAVRCGILVLLDVSLLFCQIASAPEPQVIDAVAELAVAKAAREKGNSEDALYHVQRALFVNPELIEAHFVLGSIADDMCHPNAQPGPDERLCALAFQEYAKVLKLDGTHQGALTNLAYLSYQFNRLDEAESNYRKDLMLNAEDPEALCGVVAVDLRRSWSDLATTTNGDVNQPRRGRFINSPRCGDARSRNQARVDEGIALITRALHVRNDDIELMGYLAVLYWLRAEIQCGNQQAYNADTSTARRLDRTRQERWRSGRQSDFLQKCPSAPNFLTDDK